MSLAFNPMSHHDDAYNSLDDAVAAQGMAMNDTKAAEDLFGHEPPDWKRGGPTHRVWCNADHRKPIGSDSCSCDTPVADYAASNNDKSHGTGRDIYPLVVADIEARAQVGEKKYGERLKAFNGRNAMTDAYQEALDLAVYLRQHIEETAALRAENEGLKRELDAAVSHHSRYVKTIDRALGEPRFDDCEIMVAHVRAIDALKAEVERLKERIHSLDCRCADAEARRDEYAREALIALAGEAWMEIDNPTKPLEEREEPEAPPQ